MTAMKYFTPQLFVRLQDIHDDSAAQQWERVSQEYAAAIADVLPQLPAALRRLTKEVPLHDADVISMSRQKDTLSIALRPESPGDMLVLIYELIESPVVNQAALPPEHRIEHVAWLYDELGLDRMSGPPSWHTAQDRARADGLATVYTHDILLSNGWEVGLKFRKFRWARPETYIPSPAPVTDGRDELLTRSA